MPRRNLIVAVSSPLWMSGLFEWHQAHLRVELALARATPAATVAGDGRLFRLHDAGGFALLSESIEVKENVTLR